MQICKCMSVWPVAFKSPTGSWLAHQNIFRTRLSNFFADLSCWAEGMEPGVGFRQVPWAQHCMQQCACRFGMAIMHTCAALLPHQPISAGARIVKMTVMTKSLAEMITKMRSTALLYKPLSHRTSWRPATLLYQPCHVNVSPSLS